MIHPIITDYNFYNDRADEVNFNTDNIDYVIRDIKDTMLANNYTYLSAPQIGVLKRIICIKFDADIRTYINPCIVDSKGTPGFNIEESASVPNQKFALLRYPEIHVSYFQEDGTLHSAPVAFVGVSAMYLQQMIDILDGRLVCDGSLPILDGWDKLSAKEQDEIFKLWLDNQTEKINETKKEIESDPELSKISEGIDFLNSVREGKTILERE